VHLWHEKATRLEKYPSGRNEGPPFLRCYKVNWGAGGIWARGLLVAKDAVKNVSYALAALWRAVASVESFRRAHLCRPSVYT
jgi:hypothetical protein